MTSPRAPFDFAQPFEVHPFGCDCPSCAEAEAEPNLASSFLVSGLLASGGIMVGLAIGEGLKASGILTLLGIG
jgi:hypothetical protein